MGMVKQYGTRDGSSLTLQKGYPKLQQTGQNGWRIEYRWICNMASALSLVPAWRSACPLASFENHEATSVEINGLGDPPGWVEIIVVYTYANGISVSKHKADEIVKTSNVSSQRIPIDDPNLTTLGYTQAQIDALKKGGHLAINMNTIEYNYTKYRDSITWSEAVITEDDNSVGVGETGSPEGLTSPTSGKWMFIGRSIRDDGELVEVTDSWKFNALGWK